MNETRSYILKYQYLVFFAFLILFSCNEDLCTDKNITPEYFTYSGRIGAVNNSTILSSDGNVVICGNSDSTNIIFKISQEGTLIWRNEFETGNNGLTVGIAEANTHDLFICGAYSRNHTSIKNEILLVKSNPVGDTLWTKSFEKDVSTRGDRIIFTSDQNILVAGITEDPDSSDNYDLVLIKFNQEGIVIWTHDYPSKAYQSVYSLIETQDGNYIITGTRTLYGEPSTLLLLKLDENGNEIWDKDSGIQNKHGYSTIEIPSGDLITCGESIGPNGVGVRVLLLKTDSGGHTLWEKEFDDPQFVEVCQVLSLNSDGSYLLGGYARKASEQEKPLILRADSNGKVVACEVFGNSLGASRCHNIISMDNKTNIITGWYGEDIFMANINVN